MLGTIHLRFNNSEFRLLLFLIAFLTTVIQISDEQDSFYFDPAPVGLDVREGEEVQLRCDVSNRKDIVFYWTLNGKTITNTTRRFQDDSDLRILSVDHNLDSGSLRCVATNFTTGIALRSTEAKLNISWIDPAAEVQLVEPVSGEIVEGSELILQCKADGNPEPIIDWFQNKLRIFPSDRIWFSKNLVKISNVTVADNGVVSCQARNAANMAESTEVFLVNVAGSDSPVLLTDTFTHSILVKKAGKAVFNCQYQDAVVTEWYFANNSLIVNGTSDQKFVTLRNGSLLIHKVDKTDAGVYRCVGIGGKGGPVQTFAVELFLAYLDDLTESQFDPRPSFPQVVPVNGKFEIQCQLPRGLPLPTRWWQNPQGAMITDQGRVKATGSGQLILTNVQEEDSGNYTCHVENLAEMKRFVIWVIVSVQPLISRPPLSVRVMEGESAMFDCRVSATPYPATVISWIKDEVPLDPSDARILVDATAGTLRIREVLVTDEGSYACLVNSSGHPVIQSTNGHLYVEKKLHFKLIPVNSKLELGSNSTIRCMADGRIPPRTKWVKSGSVALPENVFDSSGVLSFRGVEPSHSGLYTCIASSEQGTINTTIMVDIVVRPKLKLKPFNTTAFEGYSVMIHCVAVGHPQPTVQWDKNNRVDAYDHSRFKVLPNGSLYISEVYIEDFGKYGCTAGNSVGFEREEAYLTVLNSRLNGLAGVGSQEVSVDVFNLVKTVTIAVCSAVAYLGLVIGLIVYCSIRLIRNKNNRTRLPVEAVNGSNGTAMNEMTELVGKQRKGNVPIVHCDPDLHSNSVVGSRNSRNFQRSYDHIAFPRGELQTLGMLGKGYYGDVFLAKAFGIREGESETLVVVKSLLLQSDQHQTEFSRELELLGTATPHDHVVQLLGVCQEMDPMFLITEYCEWGDLKQFLLTMSRENGKSVSRLTPLSPAQKIAMCLQVGLGMEHLASSHLVHRDLAARNVLLSSNLNVKVAGLGLCRDIYASEYFVLHQRPVPLRWMAPEAVLDSNFSTSSDVWSFGVFVWEVFTFASLPFGQKSDEEVLREIRLQLNHLQVPLDCPEDILSLVERCMTENPKARPSFSEAVIILNDLKSQSGI